MSDIIKIRSDLSTVDKNPMVDIEVFLRMHNSNKNTFDNYKRSINQFFIWLTGEEEIMSIPIQVVEGVKNKHIMAYGLYLKDNGSSGKTINNKITAVISLYKFLQRNEYNVVAESLKPMRRFEEDVQTKYSAFTREEILDMIQLAKSYPNGSKKSFFIEVAYKTAFRRDALLSLKPSDIYIENNICKIKTIDKGNKLVDTPLSREMVTKFEKYILDNDIDKNELLFNFKSTTVSQLIRRLKKDLEIHDERKVFHSIKKSSIQRIAHISGHNIKIMQEHGNHSSASTTLNHYIEKDDSEYAGYMEMFDGMKSDYLDGYSLNELKQTIKDCSIKVQIEIYNKLYK